MAKIFESVTENCKVEDCEDSDSDEDDHFCEKSVGFSDDEDFTIRQKKQRLYYKMQKEQNEQL